MQTTRKNVKRLVERLLYGLSMLLVLATVIFILPNEIGVRILFLFALVQEWGGYALLFVLVAWLFYWTFKDKQKSKRRSLAILCSIAMSYALVCLISLWHQTSYGDCDYVTKLLNGGVQAFNGRRYTISMCSTNFFLGNGRQVRLQVFDEAGGLQALRYFTFYWNDGSEKELEYGDDVILYYDKSASQALHSIKIPPTKLDWIRARLPLAN